MMPMLNSAVDMDKSAICFILVRMGSEPKLFFNPLVKKLIESFSYCFDVKITFYSLNMEEWLVGYHTDSSDFCTMIQQKLKVRYRCLNQDNTMSKKCRRLERKFVYRCHGGLSEALLPIKMDGKMIAIAMLGQFRMEGEIPKLLRSEWKEAGYDEKELSKAFHDRPFFSSERIDKMLYIFSATLEFLVHTQNMTIKKPELVERILGYVEEKIDIPLSIDDVAKALDKSPSTITHTLKARLDMSFKQLVITEKIQKWERIIINDPTISVTQAAHMVGYDDAMYFSRLYRSKKDTTPTDFIDMVNRSRKMGETETKALLE